MTKHLSISFKFSETPGEGETSVEYFKLLRDARLKAKRRSSSLNCSMTPGKDETSFGY